MFLVISYRNALTKVFGRVINLERYGERGTYVLRL